MARETCPAMLMMTSSPAPDSASSVTRVWRLGAQRRDGQRRTLRTDRTVKGGVGLAPPKRSACSLEEMQAQVERDHREISVRRHCELLGVNRSGLYYEPVGASEQNLLLMRLLDEQYTRTPF